jgi:hypothetical protein
LLVDLIHQRPQPQEARRDPLHFPFHASSVAPGCDAVIGHKAFTTGVVLFVLNVALGTWFASALQASRTTLPAQSIIDRSVTITSFTTTVSTGGTFNWLLFAIFMAAGMVCLGVGATAAALAPVSTD